MDIRCQQASVKIFTKNRRKFIKILQTFDTIKITINLQANDMKINSYSTHSGGEQNEIFLHRHVIFYVQYFKFLILCWFPVFIIICNEKIVRYERNEMECTF